MLIVNTHSPIKPGGGVLKAFSQLLNVRLNRVENTRENFTLTQGQKINFDKFSSFTHWYISTTMQQRIKVGND